MNIHKQVLTTASLLMVFAIIGAAIVGLTYENTYEKIKRNEQEVLLRKLNTILAPSEYDNDLLDDEIMLEQDVLLGTIAPSRAYLAYKNNTPVAAVLSPIAPNGYSGPINLLVGIYHDGTVAGVRVVKHRETPGLGDAVESQRSDWIVGFDGKSLNTPSSEQWKVKRDGGEFDQFTGATITPRAVVKAVHSALIYFQQHRKQLFNENEDGSNAVKDS
ncbi:MAG: electron transport complex subunit RsxG [Gammaproteobacteria bacterium]